MKWLCIILVLVSSAIAYANDPHQEFLVQLREKFISDRKNNVPEDTGFSIPKAYLAYRAIEFDSTDIGYDDLDRHRHDAPSLTKLFQHLTTKSPDELYIYYARVVNRSLEDERNIQVPRDFRMTRREQEIVNLESEHFHLFNDPRAFIYFNKYSDDAFDNKQLDTVLKIIRFFGSFKTPITDWMEEYEFWLNDRYSHREYHYWNHSVAYPSKHPVETDYAHRRAEGHGWEFLNEVARSHGRNILSFGSERKQYKAQSYNLITPELEDALLPTLSNSIASGVRTKNGRSFLHYVTTMADATMLAKLLEAPQTESFLEYMDREQKTPLLYASEFGTYKNIELLIPRANVRAVDLEGDNVLHLALRNRDHRVLLCLLRDISAEDLRHLLLAENDFGLRPIEIFATKSATDPMGFDPYSHQSQKMFRLGQSINGVQHFLYYIPLLVKENELGINASHRPFQGL